jgi:hypothetical protein
MLAGGGGWIRTSVRVSGQIYSLLPLTTRPPLLSTAKNYARFLGQLEAELKFTIEYFRFFFAPTIR